MKYNNLVLLGVVVLLALGLVMSTGCAKKEGEEQVEEPAAEEPQAAEPEVELPAAVVEAIEANVPGAEIDFVEVAEEAGITLYDIEFKSDRGEIEVAVDGTVLDVVTIITMEERSRRKGKWAHSSSSTLPAMCMKRNLRKMVRQVR